MDTTPPGRTHWSESSSIVVPMGPQLIPRHVRVHLETGINADVVIGGPGIEESFRSRAELADLGGTVVPVAAAEDVVAMKILGGRSKDREDVVAIIAAQGPALNYDRIRATLELLEKALDRSDLVVELGRARAEATR